MTAFIANLGYKNVHWPLCLAEQVLTLQTNEDLFGFWQRNDPDGWLDWATANETLMNGRPPPRSVASRWFNLLTIFHETTEDIWLHRADEDLYWTISRPAEITCTPIPDPFGDDRPHILLKRRTDPWSNQDREGRRLQWRSLHPKSHDFLQTEATYQELSTDRDYRAYATALIEGTDLGEWHNRPEWREKLKAKGTVKTYSTLEKTIFEVGSSRVDLQACKLEYSIVSPK